MSSGYMAVLLTAVVLISTMTPAVNCMEMLQKNGKDRESTLRGRPKTFKLRLNLPLFNKGTDTKLITVHPRGFMTLTNDTTPRDAANIGANVISGFQKPSSNRDNSRVTFSQLTDITSLGILSTIVAKRYPTKDNEEAFSGRICACATFNDMALSKDENVPLRSSFQINIVYGSKSESYAVLIYPTAMPLVRAMDHAFLVDDEGRKFLFVSTIKGHRRLNSNSNIDVPGVYVLRLSSPDTRNVLIPEKSKPESEVEPEPTAETRPEQPEPEQVPEQRPVDDTSSCSSCDVDAMCVDRCCVCPRNLYGNGKICKNIVDSFKIPGVYIMSSSKNNVVNFNINSNRVYFSMSEVKLGDSRNSRYFISLMAFIGYLFSMKKDRSNTPGFSITGGKIRYESVLRFESMRNPVKISATFNIARGKSLSNQMEFRVEGELPSEGKIAIFKFTNDVFNYHYMSPGVVKMNKRLPVYTSLGNQIDVMHIQDTITFDACSEDSQESLGVKLSAYSANESPSKRVIEDKGDRFYSNDLHIVIKTKPVRVSERKPTESTSTIAPRNEDCSSVNNCHKHAECMFDRGEYSCKCKEGFRGNGVNRCTRVQCNTDASICHSNAECVQMRYKTYGCQCKTGYVGNGVNCRFNERVPQTSRGNSLIYSQGMALIELPFHPSANNPGSQIAYMPGSTIVGLSVDCITREIFYTDVVKRQIGRLSTINPSSTPEVIVDNLGSPEGVAVDWLSRNIYYTDSVSDTIEVSTMDGSVRKVLFSKDIYNPRAIVVDPVMGYIFWSDWQRDQPRIVRSTTSGTERTTILDHKSLGIPNGLALDMEKRELCYTDAGTSVVRCCSYQGDRCRDITSDVTSVFGLAYNDNTFYWTDWNMQSISNIANPRFRESNVELNAPLALPPGGNGKLYGITVALDKCPISTNACARENGGCPQMCLPDDRRGKVCICGNGEVC